MREEEVDVLYKILFITISIIIYFVCIFVLGAYAKKKLAFKKGFIAKSSILAVVFILLMVLLCEYMYINIIVTVLYVMSMFFILYKKSSL